MTHLDIDLSKIDKNPHRTYALNPINEDEVAKQMASIQRNDFWENVVVRPNPTKPGHYQLAYGHHRLQALKNLKYKKAGFIVKELNDWAMYTAMVDENATQANRTTGAVIEDVKAGIPIVEKALKSAKTLEEFNLAVLRDTANNRQARAEFTKAKERLANGEGLGRGFLSTVLPNSITPNQINAVAGSVYGEKLQRAKTKLAAAKRKQAAATKDRQEAKRLQQEAKQIEEEARRIGGSAVAHDVMVTLSSPGKMAAFVETIKRERIPKEHHKAAAQHVLEKDVSIQRMAAELSAWWFTRSGREAKMRDKAARELFKKRHSNKTPDSFAIKLITDMKKLDEGVAALTEYVVHVNNKNIRSRLSKQALNTIEKLQRLHQAIDKHDVVFVDFKALTHR